MRQSSFNRYNVRTFRCRTFVRFFRLRSVRVCTNKKIPHAISNASRTVKIFRWQLYIRGVFLAIYFRADSTYCVYVACVFVWVVCEFWVVVWTFHVPVLHIWFLVVLYHLPTTPLPFNSVCFPFAHGKTRSHGCPSDTRFHTLAQVLCSHQTWIVNMRSCEP